jgi:hypothetical protein
MADNDDAPEEARTERSRKLTLARGVKYADSVTRTKK